ncbi:hypothetical protein OGAPHI_002559 [Ogataea philodendri]|uniref:Uncharacterized protein n=1 Tax=Ogataea philodendri TaxID=1378263 RepID=A0A9P8PCM6_9ASCO|nr:uncharacterized protein OGAPHI_002559 [Ogataea philodendri]KAH3668804.1 hypothetical protein OGAPHI_002559 [Ogataea philodendri]
MEYAELSLKLSFSEARFSMMQYERLASLSSSCDPSDWFLSRLLEFKWISDSRLRFWKLPRMHSSSFWLAASDSWLMEVCLNLSSKLSKFSSLLVASGFRISSDSRPLKIRHILSVLTNPSSWYRLEVLMQISLVSEEMSLNSTRFTSCGLVEDLELFESEQRHTVVTQLVFNQKTHEEIQSLDVVAVGAHHKPLDQTHQVGVVDEGLGELFKLVGGENSKVRVSHPVEPGVNQEQTAVELLHCGPVEPATGGSKTYKAVCVQLGHYGPTDVVRKVHV